MAEIEFDDVVKRYPDGFEAVKHLNLEITDGELLVLVGPSGCGKSTALRMIAGLEDISEGDLKIGGEVVNDLAPKDRDIAMVFQNYALYPHMSVRDNMGFALKLRKEKSEEINRRVNEAAKILDLEPHLDRKPANLSGGQRQRVAMGRAIVREPKAFLMDEPLSNLDAKLRVEMRAAVSRLQQRLDTTTVYVTHDQTEAMTLGAPRRRHARRHPAAGRGAEGALREPDEPLRGGLHRLAGDELLLGPAGERRDQDADGRHPARRRAAPAPGEPRVGRARGHRRHPPGGLRGRAVRPRGPRAAGPSRRRSSSPSRWARRSTPTSTSRAARTSRPRSCASSRRTPGTSDVPGSASGHAVARVDASSTVKAGERSKLWLDVEKLHLFDPSDGASMTRAPDTSAARRRRRPRLRQQRGRSAPALAPRARGRARPRSSRACASGGSARLDTRRYASVSVPSPIMSASRSISTTGSYSSSNHSRAAVARSRNSARSCAGGRPRPRRAAASTP